MHVTELQKQVLTLERHLCARHVICETLLCLSIVFNAFLPLEGYSKTLTIRAGGGQGLKKLHTEAMGNPSLRNPSKFL